MFYMQDSATGKQTSLRTRDETEAKSLLEARNAAQRQPVLNLHLARAYLTASDPAFVERTWQVVMEQMQSRGKDSSRERYAILVHPREIFRVAIMTAASAVVVMHNHPSGESTPSEADIKVTRDLIRAGQLLKMEVIDHVVMGNGNHSSLRELGYFYV